MNNDMKKRMCLNIALLEDDPLILEGLSHELNSIGHKCFQSSRLSEVLEVLSENKIDLIISDVCLDNECGVDLLEILEEKELLIPTIYITATENIEQAVRAMKLGACDYIKKDFELSSLQEKIQRSIEQFRPMLESRKEKPTNTKFIGNSASIQKLKEVVNSIKEADIPILIGGESGTGKEVMAKYIHENSSRAKQNFFAINCASIPAELIESELFGHVKGSFTDAKKDRAGIFLQADKGTLLLDEIGEMPLAMQTKLLRVLQEKKIKHIGDDQEISINTRVIAATNKDLKAMIQKGLFREDLYYRLNLMPIVLPPLRERREDILLLAQHFLEKYIEKYNKTKLKRFSSKVLTVMSYYDWPGNIRELENTVERAVILAQGIEVTKVDLFLESKERVESSQIGSYTDMEKEYLQRVLDITDWNVKESAQIMNIGWRSLYRKIEAYSLQKSL